ncbi:MAG: hypothetical protein ACO1PI_05815 [Bacteroidota bacterium]
MSRAYKFHNTDGLYFVTFATVGWIDVFSQVAAAQPALQTCESGGTILLKVGSMAIFKNITMALISEDMPFLRMLFI